MAFERNEKLEILLQGYPIKVNDKQYNFLNHFINSNGHGNLVGIAGAGKSLMLHILSKYYGDEIVFMGSTGVASQNLPDGIGIGTGHAFLSLPIGLANDYNYKKISRKCSELFATSNLVKIVVTEEAYLYNSDTLDVIWRRIQRFNKGNKNRKPRDIRILLVGDPCQATPIADKDMKQELEHRWGSHLMFRSSVWERFNFSTYVLDKVERQEDPTYKACLDVIRYNEKGRFDRCLSWLNKRVNYNYDPSVTVLAATNKTVDRINNEVLHKINKRKIHYKPKIKGDFNIKDTLMREEGVTLCEGLKVMTIVNDPLGNWSNGSIGWVTMVESGGCYVRFESDPDSELFVPLNTWENKEVYVESVEDGYGNTKEELKERVIGKMTCIQLLPASAISISKSQGLTIKEDYVIDLEKEYLYTWDKMEDFGTNFTYLALSRGVDINKLHLATPVTKSMIKVCEESIKFWHECKEMSVI